eukprot:15460113-Alexandrium_andersonii.AAC.1
MMSKPSFFEACACEGPRGHRRDSGSLHSQRALGARGPVARVHICSPEATFRAPEAPSFPGVAAVE